MSLALVGEMTVSNFRLDDRIIFFFCITVNPFFFDYVEILFYVNAISPQETEIKNRIIM